MSDRKADCICCVSLVLASSVGQHFQRLPTVLCSLRRRRLHGSALREVAPAEAVRAVPLPCVARGVGSTVVYPPHAEVAALFGAMGGVAQVKTEGEATALQAATGLMGPYRRPATRPAVRCYSKAVGA